MVKIYLIIINLILECEKCFIELWIKNYFDNFRSEKRRKNG